MNTPIGPSMALALTCADLFGVAVATALKEIWDVWLGPTRSARKLRQFERRGLVRLPGRQPGLDRVVVLTEEGRAAAWGGRNPERLWVRDWDGRWRAAVFDVPESNRSARIQFRRKLSQLGFGYLQDSFWITPDSIQEVCRAIDGVEVDAEVLVLMEMQPQAGETDADLVAGAWNFDRINQRYLEYLEVVDARPVVWPQRHKQEWMWVEWKAWRRAVHIDPLLPRALWPKGYLGEEAWKCRKALFENFVQAALK